MEAFLGVEFGNPNAPFVDLVNNVWSGRMRKLTKNESCLRIMMLD